MNRVSSYINSNYDSPNIKDIKYTLRLREIEEIDKRFSTKNLLEIVCMDNATGEVNRADNSQGVDQKNFRK